MAHALQSLKIFGANRPYTFPRNGGLSSNKFSFGGWGSRQFLFRVGIPPASHKLSIES